nr:cell wall integrity and stress response component 4-like isoform X2 [Aedes albopictus]
MMYYYLLLIAIYVLTIVHSETIETGTAEAALQCNLCVDRFNWTHCDEAAKPKECSTELVDATHNFLAQYSPELNNTRSGGRQFRCFRLELEIDVSSVNVFIRGCTYDDTTFCDGWSANGAKAINCAICSTGVCERNATWDVIPETTTSVGPSTTTAALSTTGQSSPSTTTTVVITEAPSVLNRTTTSTVETTPEKMVSSTSSISPTSTSTTKATSTTVSSHVTQTSSEAVVRTTTSDLQSGVTGATPANTFNCTECESVDSWENCRNRSRVTQCTVAAVNELHSSLRQFNPNLPVGNYSEFKCFSMKANFSDAEHGGVAYGMGCTFASTRFCTRSEWHNVTIMECSGASLLNAGSVTGLAIVATLMMFVCQLNVKW